MSLVVAWTLLYLEISKGFGERVLGTLVSLR